jgi:acetyl-CoA carboxylase biotin carboxyl carrier protein
MAAASGEAGRSTLAEASATGAKSTDDDGGFIAIRSPMVGTFYAAASPDSPPFVKVGDQVGPESTVCIVEAMKVFNEIPAECSGKIVAVLATNGASVEYGQALFRVAPNV